MKSCLINHRLNCKAYDKVIVTNLPAFYKKLLYNAIAQKSSILVLYTGDKQNERNKDFFHGEMGFDYIVLHHNFLYGILQMISILHTVKYKKLLIGGWDNIIFWICAFFSRKKRNSLTLESSAFESKTYGIRKIIKKVFLCRIRSAYVSGLPHKELMNRLDFKGEILVTGGCGILNYSPQVEYAPRKEVRNFLYVGRLVEEKNLHILIDVFNSLPFLNLTIIGFGPMEDELKKRAQANIFFKGAIKNKDLFKYYRLNDVFVLPSISEPWGLVVEEALNNGTPVIVSSKVGCSQDLVTKETGIIFNIEEEKKGLYDAIIKMLDIELYNRLRYGVSKLDFYERVRNQVNVYLKE